MIYELTIFATDFVTQGWIPHLILGTAAACLIWSLAIRSSDGPA